MKKSLFRNLKKITLACLAFGSLALTATSCTIEDAFIFSGTDLTADPIETFDGSKNAIFFALYNYYGYEGQHFTNKWLGMRDALENHGIIVDNYMENKDAKTFTITRTDSCDLPKDAVIYMVNNQEWDVGIQYTTPISKLKPMAIISTCNGVEFASTPIASSGVSISNATMAGFSDTYKKAMKNGTLRYLCAKYASHILPIVAACVDAYDNNGGLRKDNGEPIMLSIQNWAVQTYEEYLELEKIDSISKDHPTVRACNVSQYFDKSSSNYGVNKLNEFVSDSSKESIKALYELNGTNSLQDAPRTGAKIKCGLLVPSSVNDQVQKYIDYIKGYCAYVYNLDIITYPVTSTNSQDVGATTLCNQGCNIIISLQDDTNRNKAIKIANDKGVYFGIAGTTQNPVDYEVVKDLPYYVGSIGTSIDEERRAAREMTEYYLQCMIHRAAGDLVAWQAGIKGIELPTGSEEEN